jgi:hypothetical protein
MPQPNSGRMTRSPFAVERIIQIDSRMSDSNSDIAIRPVLKSTRTGYFQPRPKNALALFATTAYWVKKMIEFYPAQIFI